MPGSEGGIPIASGGRDAAGVLPVELPSSAPARFAVGLVRRLKPGRRMVMAVPYAWLSLFFLIPFLIVLTIAFTTKVPGIPPFAPLIQDVGDFTYAITFNLKNFFRLAGDAIYVKAYLESLRIAAVSTLCCLLVGYPVAYAITKADPKWRPPLLMLMILPFWTSFLIRVYAWIGLLRDDGLLTANLNALLMGIGLIDSPLKILYTPVAAYIGITYSYLPFMILPLYATLEKLDGTLLEAAADLGCRPWKAFLTITLPLSFPGIIAGSMLVFIPATGEFVIPELLGGPNTLMIGRVLWSEFFNNTDWPAASAVAVALLLFLVVPIMVFQWVQGREQEAGK